LESQDLPTGQCSQQLPYDDFRDDFPVSSPHEPSDLPYNVDGGDYQADGDEDEDEEEDDEFVPSEPEPSEDDSDDSDASDHLVEAPVFGDGDSDSDRGELAMSFGGMTYEDVDFILRQKHDIEDDEGAPDPL
jgi:hypothetical protein